jgi:ADP-heptose:LPS heptosyltransferase
MAKKKGKGTVVIKADADIKAEVKRLRKEGYMLFVDTQGDIKKVKLNRKGAKKGHKYCRAK